MPRKSAEERSCRISAVIIAQDDESRIAGAIASCKAFAEEIVVVDGGSSDGTVRIAELMDCRVFVHAWPGYAKQRNYGSDRASHDWIFVIDTDEVVDGKLSEAICKLKADLSDERRAYAVYRIGDFLGRWMDRGEYLVRLYNRRHVRFTETLVHETPDVPPSRVTRIPGTLLHYGFRSIHDHVRRFNRYTDLECDAAAAAGKRFRMGRLLVRPPMKFIQKFMFHGLWRKGVPGLAVAVFWAHYEFLVCLKQYEREALKQMRSGAETAAKAGDKETVKEGKAYAIR